MGLRSLHAFNHEYASAFALLKAVFAHRRPRPGMPKVPGYVAHFACREGSWLAAAKALGVARVMGIDTSAMRETPLCIEPGEFHDMDLAQIKVVLPQKADLIICVEYAHQLNPERGAGLVADLCESADLVLFGAGIPRQDNHPDHNYQWQSYWAKQFAERVVETSASAISERVWLSFMVGLGVRSDNRPINAACGRRLRGAREFRVSCRGPSFREARRGRRRR